MHTDSGMTGISLSGYMPYMTVASLEMSDEPYNNYLVEIGRYRWLHYQGFACVACRDYHLIPLI